MADLRALCAAAGADAFDRLGLSPAQSTGLRGLVARGLPPIPAAEADGLLPVLKLAAAFPEEDFAGFLVATAILLADRLQEGPGDDDLFWYWDAFLPHYELAPRPFRAAILNAFLEGRRHGRTLIPDPPAPAMRATQPREEVRARLAALPQGTTDDAGIASELIAGIEGGALPPSARTWAGRGAGLSARTDDAARALQDGFRHLYETCLAWDPTGLPGPAPNARPPLIPWRAPAEGLA